VRNDRLRLQDILASIAEIADSLPPSQADFDANKFVQSHILRHIQIIGEAAWRVSEATCIGSRLLRNLFAGTSPRRRINLAGWDPRWRLVSVSRWSRLTGC
jgi:hypothetical protein